MKINDPEDGWVAHPCGKIWWRLNVRGGCTQFQDARGYLLFFVAHQLSPDMIQAVCTGFMVGVCHGRGELQGEFVKLLGLP